MSYFSASEIRNKGGVRREDCSRLCVSEFEVKKGIRGIRQSYEEDPMK